MCDNSQSQNTLIEAVLSDSGLGPNQQVSMGGFFIVSNYYSPSSPSGSLTTIDNVIAYVDSNAAGGIEATPTPGQDLSAYTESDNQAAVAMPLDVTQSTNCTLTFSPPCAGGAQL